MQYQDTILDLAIVGGGPAGLSAGLYATRGGLKNVVMFEPGLPGGAITGSSEIENYPGVFRLDPPLTGMELMERWQEQCFHFGLKHEMVKIARIQKKDDLFVLADESGKVYQAKSVIVATGSTPKRAGFKGEEVFFGRGVSTCATCDGFFYKDKPVTVVGGGDTALEEAIYLSNICSDVYVVHRRDSFRAIPYTIERAKSKPNIRFILNSVVEEVYGDASGVQGVKVKDLKTGEIMTLETPGVFVFVGHQVNNDVLKREQGGFICNVNDAGKVEVTLRMHTSLTGLFAAGDLRAEASAQVVCAAGDGATAAIEAIKYLEKR